MKAFDEIRRRNVHRTAIGYAAGAWLLVQLAETLFPVFGLGGNAVRTVVILIAIGFVPALVMSWFFEWTSDGFTQETNDEAVHGPLTMRELDRAIVVVLVAAVGYFAIDKFVIDPARDAREIEQARQVASVGSYSLPERSIAVLPFVNTSSDPEQDYFSDGMTEEILNLLAKIPELKVISRSTVFSFKNRNLSIPEVAAQLGVTHVLDGSVRKSGDALRITVQLIETAEDAHLWSEAYDRTLEDVFAIQNEISQRVVSALRLKLLDQAPTTGEIDPRAYDLYLQARHIVHTTNNANQFEVAKEKLEQLLEIEPDFMPGLFGLARLHLRFHGPEDDAAEVARIRNEIQTLVDRMYAIAPMSGYTQGFKAYIAQDWFGDYERAAFHRERALEGSVDAHVFLQLDRTGGFVAALGRYDEALAISEYVISRDPACTPCLASFGHRMRVLERDREAAERLEKIFEWQIPTGFQLAVLGKAWLYAGEPEKALDYYERAGDTGDLAEGRLAALFDLGRIDEFEIGFAALRAEFPLAFESIAGLYGWSGQNDRAFQVLEQWMQSRGPQALNLVDIQEFRRLRSDPRWQPFIKQHDLGRKDYSHISFNPKYPPEIEAALADNVR